MLPVLAGVLIVLAIVLHASFNSGEESIQKLASSVSRNLESELVKSDVEADSILSRIGRGEATFSENSDIEGFFFIYHNGEPEFWSTNQLMPDYYQLSGIESISYIQLDEGHYLVKRYPSFGEYQLFGLIELYQEARINNDYLNSHFNEMIFPIQEGFSISSKGGQKSVDLEDVTLFYLVDQGLQYPQYQLKSIIVLLLTTASFVLLGAWVWSSLALRVKSGEFESSFLGWISFLFFLRYIMLVLDIPDAIMETGLFGSMLFAASRINPSLGDMLVNGTVLMLIALFLFNYYTRSRVLKKVISGNTLWKVVLSIVAVVFTLFATWYPHVVIQTIYYNSQVTLDITNSIQFGFPRIISLLIFMISAFSLFLVWYVVNRVIFHLFSGRYLTLSLIYIAGILIFTLYQLKTSQHFWVVIICAFVFTNIIYFSKIYRTFMQWRYRSFIYIFSILALTSFLGSFGVYEFERERVTTNKIRFADYFLIKNDNITEYYLDDLNRRIQSDLFISSRMSSPFLSKDIIEGKIRKVYLGTVFDKYDVNISVYGSDGQILHGDPSDEELALIRSEGPPFDPVSEYDNIYYITRSRGDLVKRYLNKVQIARRDNVVGYITMDLQLKKIIPNDVYFELLMDSRFIQPFMGQDYSYAVYNNGRLTYNSGDFNYLTEFDFAIFDQQPKIFDKSLEYAGHRHVALMDEENRVIVVTSDKYGIERFISNFSFLFLIQIFVLLLFGIAYSIYLYYKHVKLNYTSRIQLYFNLGFFVPLLTISLVTMSLMSNTFREEVTYESAKKASNIANNITPALDEFINGAQSDEDLNDELLLASRYAGADVNLFDTRGQLVVSSKPLIFENDLISRFLNPQAYAALLESDESEWITAETVGLLNYNVNYLAIKSFTTGDLIGVLGVPFFESEDHLDDEQVEVVTTIINIFTVVFIIFLVISYFVTKGLTFPLRLITHKLRKTTLTQFNEPLSWEADDEIGLMVSEYNKMLENLEESKRELAKSQKESAWREMAQQVAHEIKNPLTPMKLTLQHLQRKIEENGEDVEKPINTLLHHVDTLNDIASSFSSIATMPIPENEPFELVELVRKTLHLHHNMSDVRLEVDFKTDSVTVSGDEQLMGRILSNIILNAAQSVSDDREVEVRVTLQVSGKKVLLEISDNGDGIDEKIRNKVFVPNFTTKDSGSGIGLAIAKHGVEHAGGKIWFESRKGKGTSFYIELPVL